jgi:hypothetical protein
VKRKTYVYDDEREAVLNEHVSGRQWSSSIFPIAKEKAVKEKSVDRNCGIFNSLMPCENRVNTSHIGQIRLLLVDDRGVMTMKDGLVGNGKCRRMKLKPVYP